MVQTQHLSNDPSLCSSETSEASESVSGSLRKSGVAPSADHGSFSLSWLAAFSDTFRFELGVDRVPESCTSNCGSESLVDVSLVAILSLSFVCDL